MHMFCVKTKHKPVAYKTGGLIVSSTIGRATEICIKWKVEGSSSGSRQLPSVYVAVQRSVSQG